MIDEISDFFGLRKKKDSENGSGSDAARGMEQDEELDTARKNQKQMEQGEIVTELEAELHKVPSHLREMVRSLVTKARDSLSRGSTVNATDMGQIKDTLNNIKVQELLRATAKGCVLCCADVSEAALGTGVRHGLDSLSLARPVGRALFAGMAA